MFWAWVIEFVWTVDFTCLVAAVFATALVLVVCFTDSFLLVWTLLSETTSFFCTLVVSAVLLVSKVMFWLLVWFLTRPGASLEAFAVLVTFTWFGFKVSAFTLLLPAPRPKIVKPIKTEAAPTENFLIEKRSFLFSIFRIFSW